MKRVVSLVCLSVIGLVTLAAAPRDASADPKKTVAVLGLELKDDGTGIDEKSANVARLLTDALRKRAKAPNGPYTLAPGGDKELVDALLLAGCSKADDVDCMAKIGGDIVTDFLIYGSLAKSGKGYQVSLTLLDVSKKAVVRRSTEAVTKIGEIDLERKGKELYTALAGASTLGTLAISSNVTSGQVFIEGQPKGNLVKGKAQISGIEEGKVKVRIESGGSIKEEYVTVTGGQTEEVTINLDKKGGGDSDVGGPGTTGTTGTDSLGTNISTEGSVGEGRPGGMYRKMTIASGIVAIAAGGVWIYSYQQIKKHQEAHCNGGNPDFNPATNMMDCAKVREHAGHDTSEEYLAHHNSEGDKYSNITYVTGPLTVIAGGVFVYSLVRGYIAPGKRRAKETPGSVTLHRKGRTAVTLTPVVTPDGGAATFRIDW
jgi:hypothetical protein